MAIMPTLTSLSSVFRTALSGLYEPATLASNTWVPDEFGGGSYVATQRPVRIQEDRITEETRQAGGYTLDTKRFIILQDGGTLNGDSQLIVGGVTYDLSVPEQDPVKAYWYVTGVPR